MKPTGLNHHLPLRNDDFANLVEALEYAAQGDTGYNFYDGRGELAEVLSYRDLRDEAMVLARKLLALGCQRGERVAIIAETDPMFHRFFFACQYAGLVPVALPSGMQVGAHQAYVEQIRRMIESCGARVAVSPESHVAFLHEAVAPLDLLKSGVPEDFAALPDVPAAFTPQRADDVAYIQYTSGSTRFPRGVVITQKAVLANLTEIAREGLHITREDRMVAWLPFYHDMGLVGFVLLPLSSQLSADYISPRTFAMRPRLWLKVLSENRGTISSSPPFGYALCAKRLRLSDQDRFDLSAWRAACVGAERINPEPLRQFAHVLAPANFNPNAFVACYGMAECALAISFAPINTGIAIEAVKKDVMSAKGEVLLADDGDIENDNTLIFVDCGKLMPSYEMSIRDDAGNELGDRICGRICLRGPSVMSGYLNDADATAESLSADGWLDTGDIGYRIGEHVVVTSRRKDVMIINGRNIWPHDLEYVAEQMPGVRFGNVSAFAVPGDDGADQVIMVVESREANPAKSKELVDELTAKIGTHFGIQCHVDLVSPHTLPRTSSGKLSRSRAKQDYIERVAAARAADAQWSVANTAGAHG
ncbi:MAG: fatty acyl-AMP ligase [Gammaproteobacteria bacterium]|nr:fatty acyl-AMP ligase [Gammaproteobacteria bacterium]